MFRDLTPKDVTEVAQQMVNLREGTHVGYEVRKVNRIRVAAAPPGSGPFAEMQQELLGIEIPTPTDEELRAQRPPETCLGDDKYVVRRASMIQALKTAGKTKAAEFWETFTDGEYVAINKAFCVAA
jgi:hypothetical protein